jgi:hypothetical protein
VRIPRKLHRNALLVFIGDTDAEVSVRVENRMQDEGEFTM